MLSAAWFAGRTVSDVISVQYGSINVAAPATSATATITSVDTTQSVVVPIGASSNHGTNTSLVAEDMGDVVLTNATTVTARRGGGGSYDLQIAFMVIQFTGVKSIQQVVISGVDSTSQNNLTITSVNTAKTCVFARWPHMQNADVPGFGAQVGQIMYRAKLLNSTTVQQERGVVGVNRGNTSVTVVEFN